MNVQLIPDGFRNSTFEENLELLSTVYPDIYALVKNHKPESYRLCLNPDGTPNIVNVLEQTLLYPASGEEIDALNDSKVLGMARKVNFSETYLLQFQDLALKNSPVQNRAYSELLGITPMSIKPIVDAKGREDLRIQNLDPTYIPFVRASGVGLGTQLLKLLKDKTVIHISIIEPDIDLFFSSLFVIPWGILHQYFSIGSKRMSLIVGDTPENSIKREGAFIRQTFPFLTCNFGQLSMIHDDAVLSRLLGAEEEQDAVSDLSLSSGWYDDQKLGLYHSLRNIKERRPFFTGKKVTHVLRVFIIGSGPSLDESLAYIRQNCDRAVIFACGSAISPLLSAGIIPDFHIVHERDWGKDTLPGLKNDPSLKQIRLLKLNVVSPEIDCLYKETYVFQKFMDPGSALLGPGFPATPGVNPTVTNAGVAFAMELGADEVYLCGVDYGSEACKGNWHSSHTIYETEGLDDGYSKEETFEIQGNFGASAITTPLLSWSRKVTEWLIDRYQHAKYINIGGGAYISGTAECRVEDLPELSFLSSPKSDIVREITTCFSDDYSSEERFQNFEDVHSSDIKVYLDNLRLFHDATVTSKEEILHVLSMLYSAVDIGLDDPDFIPCSLLNGGIKRLIQNIYLQSSLAASDADAVKFFAGAIEVIEEFYTDVVKDLEHTVKSADSELDIIHWNTATSAEA